MGFFSQQQQPKPQQPKPPTTPTPSPSVVGSMPAPTKPPQPTEPQRPPMPLASVFTAVRAVVSPSGHLTKEQMEVLVRETGHSVFDLREVEVRLQRSLYAAAEAQALQLAGDVSDAESAFQAILQRDALHSIRKQIEESGNYEELDRIATAIGSLNR